jgi:hypothetical protein
MSNKTPVLDRIEELRGDVLARSQYVEELRRVAEEAVQEANTARRALDHDAAESRQAGKVSERTNELVEDHQLKVKVAHARADQIAPAEADVVSAEDKVRAYERGHVLEIRAELHSDAQRVAAQARKLAEEYGRKLEPVREEWNRIYELNQRAFSQLPTFTTSDIPAAGDWESPPEPTEEFIDRHTTVPEPESEPQLEGPVIGRVNIGGVVVA